jgi:hypothetical protein
MRSACLFTGILALGLFGLASSASAALLIKVDKSAQTLTVTRDGETLHTWRVSTGKTGHSTPSGNFTPFRLEEDHYSKEWDDAPMPHSVFFTKQGHAIHGSNDVKRLGLPASHGCVRLAPANAATLFGLVKREGLTNTQVVLTGSEQIALERVKHQRAAGALRRGADAEPVGSINEQGDGYQRPRPYPPQDLPPAGADPSYSQPRYSWGHQNLPRGEPDDGYRQHYGEPREYGRRYIGPYDSPPRYAPTFNRLGIGRYYD